MMRLFRLLIMISLLSSSTAHAALAKNKGLEDDGLIREPSAGQGNSNPQKKPENDSLNALGFFQDRVGDVLDSVFSHVITAAASASVGYFWRRAAQKGQLQLAPANGVLTAKATAEGMVSRLTGNPLDVYERLNAIADLVLQDQPPQKLDPKLVEQFIVCEGEWSIGEQLAEFYKHQWYSHSGYRSYSKLKQRHDDAKMDSASDRAKEIDDLTDEMRRIEGQNEFYCNYKRFEELNEKLGRAIRCLKIRDSSQLSHPPTRWDRLAGYYGVVKRAEYFAKLLNEKENG